MLSPAAIDALRALYDAATHSLRAGRAPTPDEEDAIRKYSAMLEGALVAQDKAEKAAEAPQATGAATAAIAVDKSQQPPNPDPGPIAA